MSIKDRIRRLEGRDSPGCAECRHSPERVYAFYLEDGEPKPGVAACSGCGRSLGYVIRVVYSEAEGEGA